MNLREKYSELGERDYWGLVGEMFYKSVTRAVCQDLDKDLKVESNRWRTSKEYKGNQSKGIDLKIFYKGVLLVGGETKNAHERTQKGGYGRQWAVNHVMSRFWKDDKPITKILFTTYPTNTSQRAHNLLSSYGLHIFYCDKFIEDYDLYQYTNRKFWNQTKNRIKKFLEPILAQAKKQALGIIQNVGVNRSLSDYMCNTSANASINKSNTNNKQYSPVKKTKKKPLNFKLIACYEQYRKDWGKT